MNIEDLTNAEVFELARISRELYPENVIECEPLQSFVVTALPNAVPLIEIDWFVPGE
jgi:hypothetical protein